MDSQWTPNGLPMDTQWTPHNYNKIDATQDSDQGLINMYQLSS